MALVGVGLAWMMLAGQRSARNGDRVESEDWDDDPDAIEEDYVGLADESMAYLHTGADLMPAQAWRAGGGFGDDLKEAGRTAKDKLGELGDQARDAGARARERVGRAGAWRGGSARITTRGARARPLRPPRHGSGMLRSLDEQPLVLGAIGLAIGAALGAALPPSRDRGRADGRGP